MHLEEAGSVTFRPARPDEAAQLTDLAVASKRHWGYPDALIEIWRSDLRFTPESIRAHNVTVAERTGRVVGIAGFSLSGEAAELEGLWVHPSCIGEGLGKALFHEVVAHARARGAARLIIDSDPNAEEFYLRMGASPAGSTPSKPEGRRLPRLVFSIDSW